MNVTLARTGRKNRSFYWSVLNLSIPLSIALGITYLANPAASQARNPTAHPRVATVKNMVNGDIMCYVTLVDDKGIRYESVGATFEICENRDIFLNKRVNLAYEVASVNDCQSAEPCGRTRRETLIAQMTLADNRKPQPPQIESIGGEERTNSYRLTINGSRDILFVECPANFAPKLGFLRNQYAIQCEPL